MQGIRREQLAKAKGLGIIGLMLLVAGTVHYWPRAGRDDVAPRPEPAIVVQEARPAPAVARAQPVPVAPRRAELQFRRELRFRRPEPQFRRSEPAAPFKPDAPPIVTLTALPGTQSDQSEPLRSASFVPTLAPPLAPAPIAEIQPEAVQRSGALTVAAKATGKGLAVAFQKTGAAFRRVF